jgi:uridine kinase
MDLDRLSGEPSVESFASLAASIVARPSRTGAVRLVAVDGPGGAGKTTFAGRLGAALRAATDVVTPVIHTDDFASAANPFDWGRRLLDQVVDPLVAGQPGHYQRYDWTSDSLAEWHMVPVSPVVVIEGVGAGRRELAGALEFVIWITTPADVRLVRGLERDGLGLADFWAGWIDGENRHFAADGTLSRVDLVVDGDPRFDHDADTEFVHIG